MAKYNDPKTGKTVEANNAKQAKVRLGDREPAKKQKTTPKKGK